MVILILSYTFNLSSECGLSPLLCFSISALHESKQHKAFPLCLQFSSCSIAQFIQKQPPKINLQRSSPTSTARILIQNESGNNKKWKISLLLLVTRAGLISCLLFSASIHFVSVVGRIRRGFNLIWSNWAWRKVKCGWSNWFRLHWVSFLFIKSFSMETHHRLEIKMSPSVSETFSLWVASPHNL